MSVADLDYESRLDLLVGDLGRHAKPKLILVERFAALLAANIRNSRLAHSLKCQLVPALAANLVLVGSTATTEAVWGRESVALFANGHGVAKDLRVTTMNGAEFNQQARCDEEDKKLRSLVARKCGQRKFGLA